MKTKKIYETPDMVEVNLEPVTLLAGSDTDFGAGGTVNGDENGNDQGSEWTP